MADPSLRRVRSARPAPRVPFARMDDPRPWHVWIDTGGTFTDAVAIGPRGQTRSAKVLSTGALRAAIAEQLGPRRFRIRHEWGGVGTRASGDPEPWQPPADLIRGFAFRRLGAHES